MAPNFNPGPHFDPARLGRELAESLQHRAHQTEDERETESSQNKPHIEKPRKPSSPRKIHANRKNAQRSTDPKTPEGLKKSSQNARKDGLTATTSPTPDEALACAQGLPLWVDSYKPRTPGQWMMVGVAVQAAAKLQTIWAVTKRRRLTRLLHYEDNFMNNYLHDIEYTIYNIKQHPLEYSHRLDQTPGGLTYKLERLRDLDNQLATRGSWYFPEVEVMLNLLGLPRNIEFCVPQTRRIMNAHVAAGGSVEPYEVDLERKLAELRTDEFPGYQRTTPAPPTHVEVVIDQMLRARGYEPIPADDPTRAAACAHLRAECQTEMTRLRGLLPRAQAAFQFDLESARLDCLIDTSPAARLHQRYETASVNALTKAVRYLDRALLDRDLGAEAELSDEMSSFLSAYFSTLINPGDPVPPPPPASSPSPDRPPDLAPDPSHSPPDVASSAPPSPPPSGASSGQGKSRPSLRPFETNPPFLLPTDNPSTSPSPTGGPEVRSRSPSVPEPPRS